MTRFIRHLFCAAAVVLILTAVCTTLPGAARAVEMGMPILIVDNYKGMLRIVRNQLRGLNFTNIDKATDGEMALKKLNDV